MLDHQKNTKQINYNSEPNEDISNNHDNDGLIINFNFQYTFNCENIEFHVEKRSERGGQNAINHSQTANKQSKFADTNERSGISGNNNDESGGHQGIKVRDNQLHRSRINSSFDHSEVPQNGEQIEDASEATDVEW